MKQWKTPGFLMASVLVIGAASLVLNSCGGGGGGGGGGGVTPTPTPAVGSSATGSGSTAVFTSDGVTSALTPGAGGGSAVKLLTLPNTGSAVGALTVDQVSATPITTSLTSVSGTSVDPAQDLGMAFDYHDSKVSFFTLSTKTEVGTYDTLTAQFLSFSGVGGVKIAGAVMNPTNKTVILATADGFEIVDYTDPVAPVMVREVPSLAVDATNGVEIMENFAFDPALPVGGTNYAMIITGGNYGYSDPIMTLVDSSTGKVYRPDTTTAGFFAPPNWYIDSAAVDTNYHVAILADEGTGTTFVDLNQLTLDSTAGTYALPAAAVNRITTYVEMDNLAIESTNHLVMMGAGYGGSSLVAGLLQNPTTGLGFSKEVAVTMPSGTDNTGATVYWSGSYDPHGAGAYITPSDHPTEPNRSLGLWMSGDGDHIAIIDLLGVLDGTLAGGGYDPSATTPKDIAYFAIP